MSQVNAQGTPLAEIVRAADNSELPVQIADGVYMSEDVSNSYAVGTSDGYVAINTGTVAGGAKHLARYRAAGLGSAKYVILTQHHADHRGGVLPFVDEGAKIIADWRFPEGFTYNTTLLPFYLPKWERIWRPVLKDGLPDSPTFPVNPDILVEWEYVLEHGGRRFEIFSVPGGETLDSVCVWMPMEKIVFTGNLFGPAFMTIPNVNTLRMDKPRSIIEYIRNADRVLKLGAEMLVTGHGEPIRGAAEVDKGVRTLRDALQYIHDETVRRMNAGEPLEKMMKEIELPADLKVHEWYGTVPWTIKTLYHEYVGWWDQDFTSRLYPVKLLDRYPEIVSAAGADTLLALAKQHLDADRTVEGLQLVEIVLIAEPQNNAAIDLQLIALRRLLELADGKKNLQETVWLRSEIATAEQALK
jgi:alkyl sulfatase BDS1-like metallo-beta-lactamase superfamily hydrolase